MPGEGTLAVLDDRHVPGARHMRSQTRKRSERPTSSRDQADRHWLASSGPPANLLPKPAFRRPSKKKFTAMLIAGAVTLTIPSLILALVLLG